VRGQVTLFQEGGRGVVRYCRGGNFLFSVLMPLP